MRCCVTGGAGFIGSHLVDRLLADGHEVVVVDNFVTGRIANLLNVIDDIRPYHMDVNDLPHGTLAMQGVDWVFHLAGLADIVPSIADPMRYHRANVDGTVAVLEAARAAGVGRFVYAASSSCYGIPSEVPTPETAPIRPMYPYALTKYLGEQYVQHWHQVYRLPTMSLRLFNVYGPRSRTSGAYGAVMGTFLRQKLAGRPYTVVGDGTQTRDFVHVSDVVEAFIAAAKSGVSGMALNVGAGTPRSINDLTRVLGGETVSIPQRPGEPQRMCADISKIRQLLGWRPQVPFEVGVRRMLDHIEEWRDAPLWDPDSIGRETAQWFRVLAL